MPTQKIAKTELLHRCWEHFHRHGYHASSVSALAQAAGLGKAGLLHHFGSKEELMRAVIAYAMEQFQAYVFSVVAEDLPLEQRLEKLLRRQNRLSKLHQRGCFFTNLVMETGQSGLFNPIIQAFYDEWQRKLTGLLSGYYGSEAARDRAYQLLLEYEGAIAMYKLSGDERHLESYVQRAVAPLKTEPYGTSPTAA